MAQTLTAADAALKEDYQPAVREQLDNTNMILTQVEKNSKDVEGRRAILSLHVGRNSGVGARAEGATLPTPGAQSYAEERVPLRYNYGTFKVTGPLIAATKSDRGSYIRAIDSESKGIVTDLKRDVNRQIFGTSDGVIATCGTTSSATTVVLATATTLTQMRQFEVGMRIDLGTSGSPTSVASNRTITAVDRSAKTIDISGAAVSTTGSTLVTRQGSGGSGANQVELTGLRTIVAGSGTLFNVNPTTYPVWASYVDSNSGTPRTPSDALFEEALDEISIESGEDPDLLVTTAGVNRAYAATLKSQKRFSNTIDLKGGFKAITVSTGRAEVALTWDRDCPANTAFVLNTSHIFQHQSSDWSFMDRDGAVLSRASDGSDAYEAVLYKYHELTTDKRNAHGIIKDLSE